MGDPVLVTSPRARRLRVESLARWFRVSRPETRMPDDDPRIPEEYVDEVCVWLWEHPEEYRNV